MTSLTRGQVVRADIGLDEPKLFVVVSNNRRNRALPTILGVRLTTSPKPPMASIVEFGQDEVFVGRACCDDITALWEDEILSVVGAISPRGMSAIRDGLGAALGL
ncbi:hypothetical protein Back2_07250 [Nocardioides baekrokdamisoli]|uniref:Uncharacterized protein n=1 Tax=Nocardioides baekrokdamisoli TaxID=1804624 RepID=A0A3G9IYN6_9ACTN|nr:type II toxin-antitoxin system PemK/MazF family toxin [Nocardioides baekrokdamisoli]BBH16438.1 hypothetical protein Back2_07250 [Nocardioides baekrokdamisoli]